MVMFTVRVQCRGCIAVKVQCSGGLPWSHLKSASRGVGVINRSGDGVKGPRRRLESARAIDIAGNRRWPSLVARLVNSPSYRSPRRWTLSPTVTSTVARRFNGWGLGGRFPQFGELRKRSTSREAGELAQWSRRRSTRRRR